MKEEINSKGEYFLYYRISFVIYCTRYTRKWSKMNSVWKGESISDALYLSFLQRNEIRFLFSFLTLVLPFHPLHPFCFSFPVFGFNGPFKRTIENFSLRRVSARYNSHYFSFRPSQEESNCGLIYYFPFFLFFFFFWKSRRSPCFLTARFFDLLVCLPCNISFNADGKNPCTFKSRIKLRFLGRVKKFKET